MSTLASLLVDIEAYSHRGDTLESRLKSFVTLAESAMYDNDVEPLTVRDLEFTSTTTADGRIIATPNRFERTRAMDLLKGDIRHECKFQTPNQIRRRSGTGIPYFFTVIGDQIEFDVSPDYAYTVELQYYRKLAPLSADTDTNNILENHYNIYLFGALSELFSFVLDTEQEQRYTAKFYKAIKGANKADKKGRYGPAPAMTVEGCMP